MAQSTCLTTLVSWAKYFWCFERVDQLGLSGVQTPQQAPPLLAHQAATRNWMMQPVDHKHKFIIYTNRIQLV